MPRDQDFDEEPRRPSIMEQRLRRARGEEIDEDEIQRDVERLTRRHPLYDDDDDMPRYRGSGSAGGGFSLGGGCAQAVLYLVLGGLAALLIGVLFLNQTARGIGDLFGGGPDIAAILATPTPEIITGAAVIEQVRQLSRLETSSFSIERVIDIRQSSNIPIFGDFLAGDAILLIAHGNVIAGVDLSQLQIGDVTVSPDGSTITVRLPPVEIFSSTLDNQRTRVYSRDQGIFAPTNQDLETLARQEAERQILAAACEGAIMQRATDSAAVAVRQLLSLSGFAQVFIETSPPASCSTPLLNPVPTP